ncbi:hypothetical protein LXL04_023200 [Taraxacum kok-saghyz]
MVQRSSSSNGQKCSRSTFESSTTLRSSALDIQRPTTRNGPALLGGGVPREEMALPAAARPPPRRSTPIPNSLSVFASQLVRLFVDESGFLNSKCGKIYFCNLDHGVQKHHPAPTMCPNWEFGQAMEECRAIGGQVIVIATDNRSNMSQGDEKDNKHTYKITSSSKRRLFTPQKNDMGPCSAQPIGHLIRRKLHIDDNKRIHRLDNETWLEFLILRASRREHQAQQQHPRALILKHHVIPVTPNHPKSRHTHRDHHLFLRARQLQAINPVPKINDIKDKRHVNMQPPPNTFPNLKSHLRSKKQMLN